MISDFPYESKHLDIGGMKMHYVDAGIGQAILMLHGNPTWSYYYRDLIARFSKTHRVIAPDHIGMGFSDKPQGVDYCLSFHINNVTRLIGALDIKDLILIVHDWGGAIGFGYAAFNPGNVSKIVILNSAAFFDKSIPKRFYLCQGRIGRLLVRRLNMFALAATFMTTVKKLEKDVKKMYLTPYNSYANRVGVYSFVNDIPMKKSHRTMKALDDVESKLSEIDSDVLILWGGKDFCFTEHFFNRWRAFFPDARAVLYSDAGHYVLEDKADDVIKEIEEFIK